MLAIIGYVFTGITIVLTIFLFGFLIKKQEHLKKLPKWFYVLAIFTLLCGIAAIGLISGHIATKK